MIVRARNSKGPSVSTSLVLFVLYFALEICAEKHHYEEFVEWKNHYNKTYESVQQEDERFKIFTENIHFVHTHNHNPQRSFNLSLNIFADLRHQEFTSRYFSSTGVDPRNLSTEHIADYLRHPASQAPNFVDWRYRKAVSAVKHQKDCRCGWAFAATDVVESQQFLTNNIMYNISQQQLVECSISFGNSGCVGGEVENAFQYYSAGNLAVLESAYPYIGNYSGQRCRYKASQGVVNVTKFLQVPRDDEKSLQQAVATVGPVAVMIDPTLREFQFYRDGVFASSSCQPYDLRHAMLLVGYAGMEPAAHPSFDAGADQEQPYWLLKNSLGRDWGMEGYIKFASGTNLCGIASLASFAIVPKTHHH
eukprot:Sdes_comp15757_c0_seq2m4815